MTQHPPRRTDSHGSRRCAGRPIARLSVSHLRSDGKDWNVGLRSNHSSCASRRGRMLPLRGAFVKAEHFAEIGQNCSASLLGDGKRTRNV
jgi:hypothetical protein